MLNPGTVSSTRERLQEIEIEAKEAAKPLTLRDKEAEEYGKYFSVQRM